MTAKKAVSSSASLRKMRPALTPEARENQLVSLAIDLVERRLIEGTASSQETTHFLKIGSTNAKIEQDILKEQKKLIEAKTEALKSEQRSEELYANAIAAMLNYKGQGDAENY